jgi:hypothetical protein
MKIQFNGAAKPTAMRSRLRFVRKGLKGREAVAPKSKKPSWFF